jgi:putative transcriptional regulator
LCRAIEGKSVACLDKYVKEVQGYTVVDAKKAIETLSGLEFSQLFGATTERALVFTNIENGISPMLIVRVSSLKPRLVIFHGTMPDEYSIRLAEYDGIPLIYSNLLSVEQIVKSLRRLYRIALHRKLGRPVRPPPQVTA